MPLVDDDPRFAQLRAMAFSEKQKLAGLNHRLRHLDSDKFPNAYDAIEMAVERSAARLAELTTALAGPTDAELAVHRPAGPGHAPPARPLAVAVQRPRRDRTGHGPPAMTVAEAKQAARARMYVVLTAIEHLPEGCAEAAATLRKAIDTELKRLGKLKSVERRQRARRATEGGAS